MNETQLRTLLIKNPVTRPYFGGILASDELVYVEPISETFYIVNSDISTGPGKHWAVMYVDKHAEFFDSLGKVPSAYGNNFTNFLINNGPKYMFSTKRLQSHMSSLCGEFCVYFCHQRCLGYSFVEIINMFNDNLKLNDAKVDIFIGEMVKDLFS